MTSANKLKQGISGSVKEVSGNQMPGPGRELPEPRAVMTMVYVYEITNLAQVEQISTSPFFKNIKSRLVDSVASDEKGLFALALAPGNYSLFTKVDGKFFANSFDTKNNIGPVSVEANKVSEVSIVINDKATY